MSQATDGVKIAAMLGGYISSLYLCPVQLIWRPRGAVAIGRRTWASRETGIEPEVGNHSTGRDEGWR